MTDIEQAGPSAALTRLLADSLPEADPTPGMTRHRAVEGDGFWAGTARTEGGAVTGWHHHGENESLLYVVRGSLHFEYGPGGRAAFDAGAGDFVQVPAAAVHRESNPSDDESLLVVVRRGHGQPTVNVDGPAPG